MNSFDFLWQLVSSHGGVAENYKVAASQEWSRYSLDEQRSIYRSIRDKLRADRFVHYNPVIAIKDNAPKKSSRNFLTFDEYYRLYHTTLETDGWKRLYQPDKQRTIYIKN